MLYGLLCGRSQLYVICSTNRVAFFIHTVGRTHHRIQRRLETSGETEIETKTIGQLVMDALSQLDQVAYVRFASVYRDFHEARDFEEFVGKLSLDPE